MKILTYNVNGIRAAASKGLFDFLKTESPDVVCLQEIKAEKDQADLAAIENLGYHHFWFSAQKKGYSGVAVFSKIKPNNIVYGCGHPDYDFEGRCIRVDFDSYSVLSVYFPSGTTGDVRQEIKYKFLDYFYDYAHNLLKELPGLVICGDYNICHKPIDIHNPVSNKDSSGFLPEERAWMDKWFGSGFVDTFRQFNPDPDWYTWWSFRANARANNKGWRIDYISVTENLKDQLKAAKILMDAKHSDHCPMWVVVE
ncbi:MAG: exodeoxyribonuclease III [Bacteroidetes bacterium]|nr:exodeoxyribonuclease III [Bacteroidota bacterium]